MTLFYNKLLPSHRFLIDVIKLVDVLFADQILKTVSRDSNESMLDSLAIPQFVKLGLLSTDLQGPIVAVGVDRDLRTHPQVLDARVERRLPGARPTVRLFCQRRRRRLSHRRLRILTSSALLVLLARRGRRRR